MRLLLFAGTTEGRMLAQRLAEMPGVEATVCVATEYGRQTLGGLPERLAVRAGRLGREEMEALMQSGGFALVVDATHPYAVQVGENIRAAANAAGLPYRRLLRPAGMAEEYIHCASVPQAAEALRKTQGNVLITTGSKELEAYTRVEDYARRLYVRVLPMMDSLAKCEEMGFPCSHIIAMQGPFSQELNRAMMEQFDIKWLVTKDGGAAGGFDEKVQAALALDVAVLVVGRPKQENGSSFDEVLAEVCTWEGSS